MRSRSALVAEGLRSANLHGTTAIGGGCPRHAPQCKTIVTPSTATRRHQEGMQLCASGDRVRSKTFAHRDNVGDSGARNCRE